ncbi:MAG: hypothetical protein K0R65_1540 [Crocinitomicaceae bacterium]|jgi:hypothetical protein|nr:hypothetical protein [Crocinitomicaceae bacterium]
MRFFTLLIILISLRAFSQGFQVGIGSAYSVSAPNSFAGQDEKDMFLDEMSISNMRGNFGAGLNYSLELDFRLKNTIKVGVDFSYFKSNELVIRSYNRDSISQLITAQTQQIRMMPHVTLNVPLSKISFEAEAGVILPVTSYSDFHLLESNSNSGVKQSATQHYTYNFSFGFYQSIGFEKRFQEHFLLKSQLGINLFAQTTRYRTTTGYQVNDADQLSQLSLYEQETQYYPNLNNFSNNADYNPEYITTKPKDELTVSHSFSSLFFGISLAYEFNKAK